MSMPGIVGRPTLRRHVAAPVLTWLFAVALLAALAVKFWLATRQMRHVVAHRDAVPPAFAVTRLARQPHQQRRRLHGRQDTFRPADHGLRQRRCCWAGRCSAAWTRSTRWVREAVLPRWGALAYQLALLGAFVIIGAALDLPFELWRTFRIEQRFGFNRMTGGCS